MAKGGGDVTQTSGVTLTPEQKKLLGLAMPYAEKFGSSPLKWPTTGGFTKDERAQLLKLNRQDKRGVVLTPEQQATRTDLQGQKKLAKTPFDAVAKFDPSQTAGQEAALTAAGTQGDIAAGAQRGYNFLTSGDLMNVDANPYFAPAATAATRPMVQALTEQELPALRNSATSSGNFGSSRQGIAEGLATGRTNQAIGDVTGKMAMDAYGQGLNAYQSGLNMTPMVQSAQLQPALTTSGVGDVRQGQAQRGLDQTMQMKMFNKMAPFTQAADLLSLVNGTPGATTSTTGPGPSASPISGAVGGLTLGSALTPFLGPAGPLLGAGLGAASSFF